MSQIPHCPPHSLPPATAPSGTRPMASEAPGRAVASLVNSPAVGGVPGAGLTTALPGAGLAGGVIRPPSGSDSRGISSAAPSILVKTLNAPPLAGLSTANTANGAAPNHGANPSSKNALMRPERSPLIAVPPPHAPVMAPTNGFGNVLKKISSFASHLSYRVDPSMFSHLLPLKKRIMTTFTAEQDGMDSSPQQHPVVGGLYGNQMRVIGSIALPQRPGAYHAMPAVAASRQLQAQGPTRKRKPVLPAPTTRELRPKKPKVAEESKGKDDGVDTSAKSLSTPSKSVKPEHSVEAVTASKPVTVPPTKDAKDTPKSEKSTKETPKSEKSHKSSRERYSQHEKERSSKSHKSKSSDSSKHSHSSKDPKAASSSEDPRRKSSSTSKSGSKHTPSSAHVSKRASAKTSVKDSPTKSSGRTETKKQSSTSDGHKSVPKDKRSSSNSHKSHSKEKPSDNHKLQSKDKSSSSSHRSHSRKSSSVSSSKDKTSKTKADDRDRHHAASSRRSRTPEKTRATPSGQTVKKSEPVTHKGSPSITSISTNDSVVEQAAAAPGHNNENKLVATTKSKEVVPVSQLGGVTLPQNMILQPIKSGDSVYVVKNTKISFTRVEVPFVDKPAIEESPSSLRATRSSRRLAIAKGRSQPCTPDEVSPEAGTENAVIRRSRVPSLPSVLVAASSIESAAAQGFAKPLKPMKLLPMLQQRPSPREVKARVKGISEDQRIRDVVQRRTGIPLKTAQVNLCKILLVESPTSSVKARDFQRLFCARCRSKRRRSSSTSPRRRAPHLESPRKNSNPPQAGLGEPLSGDEGLGSSIFQDLMWQMEKGYFLRRGRDDSAVSISIEEAESVSQAVAYQGDGIQPGAKKTQSKSKKTHSETDVHVSKDGVVTVTSKPNSCTVTEVNSELPEPLEYLQKTQSHIQAISHSGHNHEKSFLVQRKDAAKSFQGQLENHLEQSPVISPKNDSLLAQPGVHECEQTTPKCPGRRARTKWKDREVEIFDEASTSGRALRSRKRQLTPSDTTITGCDGDDSSLQPLPSEILRSSSRPKSAQRKSQNGANACGSELVQANYQSHFEQFLRSPVQHDNTGDLQSRTLPSGVPVAPTPVYFQDIKTPFNSSQGRPDTSVVKLDLHQAQKGRHSRSKKAADTHPSAKSLDPYDFDQQDDASSLPVLGRMASRRSSPTVDGHQLSRECSENLERPLGSAECGMRLRPRRESATYSVAKMETSKLCLKIKIKRDSTESPPEAKDTKPEEEDEQELEEDKERYIPRKTRSGRYRKRHSAAEPETISLSSESVSIETTKVHRLQQGDAEVPARGNAPIGSSMDEPPAEKRLPQSESNQSCPHPECDGNCTTITTRMRFRLVRVGQGMWKTVSATEELPVISTGPSVTNVPLPEEKPTEPFIARSDTDHGVQFAKIVELDENKDVHVKSEGSSATLRNDSGTTNSDRQSRAQDIGMEPGVCMQPAGTSRVLMRPPLGSPQERRPPNNNEQVMTGNIANASSRTTERIGVELCPKVSPGGVLPSVSLAVDDDLHTRLKPTKGRRSKSNDAEINMLVNHAGHGEGDAAAVFAQSPIGTSRPQGVSSSTLPVVRADDDEEEEKEYVPRGTRADRYRKRQSARESTDFPQPSPEVQSDSSSRNVCDGERPRSKHAGLSRTPKHRTEDSDPQATLSTLQDRSASHQLLSTAVPDRGVMQNGRFPEEVGKSTSDPSSAGKESGDSEGGRRRIWGIPEILDHSPMRTSRAAKRKSQQKTQKAQEKNDTKESQQMTESKASAAVPMQGKSPHVQRSSPSIGELEDHEEPANRVTRSSAESKPKPTEKQVESKSQAEILSPTFDTINTKDLSFSVFSVEKDSTSSATRGNQMSVQRRPSDPGTKSCHPLQSQIVDGESCVLKAASPASTAHPGVVRKSPEVSRPQQQANDLDREHGVPPAARARFTSPPWVLERQAQLSAQAEAEKCQPHPPKEQEAQRDQPNQDKQKRNLKEPQHIGEVRSIFGSSPTQERRKTSQEIFLDKVERELRGGRTTVFKEQGILKDSDHAVEHGRQINTSNRRESASWSDRGPSSQPSNESPTRNRGDIAAKVDHKGVSRSASASGVSIPDWLSEMNNEGEILPRRPVKDSPVQKGQWKSPITSPRRGSREEHIQLNSSNTQKRLDKHDKAHYQATREDFPVMSGPVEAVSERGRMTSHASNPLPLPQERNAGQHSNQHRGNATPATPHRSPPRKPDGLGSAAKSQEGPAAVIQADRRDVSSPLRSRIGSPSWHADKNAGFPVFPANARPSAARVKRKPSHESSRHEIVSPLQSPDGRAFEQPRQPLGRESPRLKGKRTPSRTKTQEDTWTSSDQVANSSLVGLRSPIAESGSSRLAISRVTSTGVVENVLAGGKQKPATSKSGEARPLKSVAQKDIGNGTVVAGAGHLDSVTANSLRGKQFPGTAASLDSAKLKQGHEAAMSRSQEKTPERRYGGKSPRYPSSTSPVSPPALPAFSDISDYEEEEVAEPLTVRKKSPAAKSPSKSPLKSPGKSPSRASGKKAPETKMKNSGEDSEGGGRLLRSRGQPGVRNYLDDWPLTNQGEHSGAVQEKPVALPSTKPEQPKRKIVPYKGGPIRPNQAILQRIHSQDKARSKDADVVKLDAEVKSPVKLLPPESVAARDKTVFQYSPISSPEPVEEPEQRVTRSGKKASPRVVEEPKEPSREILSLRKRSAPGTPSSAPGAGKKLKQTQEAHGYINNDSSPFECEDLAYHDSMPRDLELMDQGNARPEQYCDSLCSEMPELEKMSSVLMDSPATLSSKSPHVRDGMLGDVLTFDSEISQSSGSTSINGPVLRSASKAHEEEEPKDLGYLMEDDGMPGFELPLSFRTLTAEIEEQKQKQLQQELLQQEPHPFIQQQQPAVSTPSSAQGPTAVTAVGLQPDAQDLAFGLLTNGAYSPMVNTDDIITTAEQTATAKGGKKPAKSRKKATKDKGKNAKGHRAKSDVMMTPEQPPPENQDNCMDKMLTQQSLGYATLGGDSPMHGFDNADATNFVTPGFPTLEDGLGDTNYLEQLVAQAGAFDFGQSGDPIFQVAGDKDLQCVDVMEETKVVIHRGGGGGGGGGGGAGAGGVSGVGGRSNGGATGANPAATSHVHPRSTSGPMFGGAASMHTCGCGEVFMDNWSYQQHEVLCTDSHLYSCGY